MSKELSKEQSPKLQKEIQRQLKIRARRRKLLRFLCGFVAVGCFTYLICYHYFGNRTNDSYEHLKSLKETNPSIATSNNGTPVIHYTSDEETPDILEEYQALYQKNRSLIGWVKIVDTNIDYPVMQTSNNEYYLNHNISQEYDKNGTIFLDCNCDVLKPSMNLIIYGHHMKSGKMFGKLDKYKDKAYWEKHPLIQFDTIYEKGTYAIVYAFQSKVYKSDEIAFKYYQFIDVNSKDEFDSYMNEMNRLSLYDTGVPVSYGDQFLTLSTCDQTTQDGRFVLVAKRVK